jgi:hypothetical protein
VLQQVPDDFDRGDVVHGEKSAFYPGLHPELRSTYNTAIEKEVQGVSSTYTGNTFYTLDTDSDCEVYLLVSEMNHPLQRLNYANLKYKLK